MDAMGPGTLKGPLLPSRGGNACGQEGEHLRRRNPKSLLFLSEKTCDGVRLNMVVVRGTKSIFFLERKEKYMEDSEGVGKEGNRFVLFQNPNSLGRKYR